MSDAVDKINLSSRFLDDKILMCVDLLFVSNSECNFEFKLLLVLIGPGVVYVFDSLVSLSCLSFLQQLLLSPVLLYQRLQE